MLWTDAFRAPLWCLTLLLAIHTVLGGPSSDEVLSLPGWEGRLPSAQWSGFLNVSTTQHTRLLHYWLVASENHPASDPVVLWLNGGPGCSSLDGLLYEHGPLLLAEDGRSLVRNNYSWARNASMLYLEAPLMVGFSHSDDPRDYNTDDNKTTADNLAAVVAFMRQLPDFSKQDFYIAGESYSGVYVPMLADAIDSAGLLPQFRGILVGNGGPSCGAKQCTADALSAYGHNLISTELYSMITQDCTFTADCTPQGKGCAQALKEMQKCTAGLNDYDAYRDCYHNKGSSRKVGRLKLGLGADPPCIDSRQAGLWLNTHEVQEAIHMKASDIPTAGHWEICNVKGYTPNDNLNYTQSGVDVYPIYQRLAGKYRILVYAGDNDGGAQRETEWCLGHLFPVVKKWRPWLYDKRCHDGADVGTRYCQTGAQVGGFTIDYGVGQGGELQYVTVHGSGHMVPQWKPQPALRMFTAFVHRQPLA